MSTTTSSPKAPSSVTRVYVGNLAWKVRWQDLKDHMKKAGEVVYADVFLDQDNRSRGCGIVEYATPEEAQRAVKELTDSELYERKIFVREDREEKGFRGNRGPSSSGGRGGFRGGSPSVERSADRGKSLFVGNLNPSVTVNDLASTFSAAGNVRKIDIHEGQNRYATVLFATREEAQAAIKQFDGFEVKGSALNVREDKFAK